MTTLTITDREDGTGADAAITDSGGATVTLYTAQFDGNLTESQFSSAGSRVGDGSIALDSDPGSYFAVLDSDGTLETPQGFRVTDGSLGLHHKCLVAVREFIIGLNLPLVPSDGSKHKLHKKPLRTLKEFGVEGCHYWKSTEQRRPLLNGYDVVSFNIEWAYARGNAGDNIAAGNWTKLRELIATGIQACPLPSIPEIHTMRVHPGELYYADKGLQMDLQSLRFECVTEQPNELS
jgi:hypothetical protein